MMMMMMMIIIIIIIIICHLSFLHVSTSTKIASGKYMQRNIVTANSVKDVRGRVKIQLLPIKIAGSV
jgi:hypothetical protein